MSDTAEIIRRLASEAGQGGGEPNARVFGRWLLRGSFCAFLLGLVLICWVFAGSFDTVRVLGSYPFHFKIATMALLAVGAFLALRQQGIPGSDARIAWALLPGPALLLVLALLDHSGFPLLGRDAASVPICFFAILGAGLPALLILLLIMRRGVVTRPLAAGACAGLLAGALGAAAYAIACRNDGAAFVFIWYDLAIGTMACAGAVAGRRFLRW